MLKNVELVERTSVVVGPSATVAENSGLTISSLMRRLHEQLVVSCVARSKSTTR